MMMKYISKIILALTGLFLMILLPACGFMTPQSSSTRVVQDDTGRNVKLPAHPKRIISLTYGTDEILLALVDEKRVLAISKFAGNPDISFLSEEEADRIPNRVHNDTEQIVALNPDLVIVSTAIPQQITDTLVSSGVPVYISCIPHTYSEMEQKIRGVAKAVNEEEKGEDMVKQMNDRQKEIDEKLSVIPDDKKRRVLALSFRGIIGKKGTLTSEIIERAHAIDVAGNYKAPKRSNALLSLELIPEMNPDVILMPVWKRSANENEEAFKDEIVSNPAYQDVNAVRNNRLVRFPEKYKYVMSQHLPDAVEAVAKAVYPEYF